VVDTVSESRHIPDSLAKWPGFGTTQQLSLASRSGAASAVASIPLKIPESSVPNLFDIAVDVDLLRGHLFISRLIFVLDAGLWCI
jgi:hypothetical protein